MNNFNVVYTWHGSPPTKNIIRRIATRYFKSNVKKEKVIVISDFMKNQFGGKSIVIKNGVSRDFRPAKKETDRGYMLYVGRLEKHKKVEELVRLSKEIDFPLKIVGYGPEKERLKYLKNSINAPVEFLGKIERNDLIKIYQECSFFVSASEWEGFGLIFIEAACCGKPSIGYDYGAIPEVIINNKTGFIVKSHEEFLEKSRVLKEENKIRARFGRNAYRFGKSFNWDKVSKRYEQIFQELVSLKTKLDN
jgi:glycosyltransferase involved in cell wall biosynthesis